MNLKALCSYLQNMPPPHHSPLQTLLQWTQAYCDPHGVQVLKQLSFASDDPHWHFLNQHYHTQDILSQPQHVEMWARLCCQWAHIPIADEPKALSESRWQRLNPLLYHHHQQIHSQHVKRQQALLTLRTRQSQRPLD